MPKVLDEDQLRRKKALEERRQSKRRAKAEQEAASKISDVKTKADDSKGKVVNRETAKGNLAGDIPSLIDLPEDAVKLIYSMLTAAELGRLAGTCTALTQMLSAARTCCVMALCNRNDPVCTGRVKSLDLCRTEQDAQALLQDSYGGGDTGRILPQGKFAKKIHMEFCAFARYLEEAAVGFAYLSTGARDPIYLPRFLQGRIASVSPEHSLCRVGGDGKQTGAGGSGLASWGVGKRGQLGHGKRQDERQPRRLVGGVGYGIRIVQCSAGGGLVRVAHSLLLTSTGRVLSFGMGQYGALGHGYSLAKQLPDQLKPRYIESLNGLRCICVAAGELHSAVVTSDGDVYSWGDGFCGQLGHGDRRPQLTPKQVTAGGLSDESVANITCGSRHTIAVTEEGEVFTWGLGHFGVLGRCFTPFDHSAEAAVAGIARGGGDQLDGIPALDDAGLEAVPRNDMDAELAAHLDLIANLSLNDSSDQCIPKIVDTMVGIKIIGSSTGHRHALLLDEYGSLYSCGAGLGGCLGHGDTLSQMHPMKITSFDDENIRIVQMSAGVDISMAVSSTGDVYGWGKTEGGRIGLGLRAAEITLPRKVHLSHKNGRPVKAVDVECGYVHSIIIALDGTIHMCGGVGVEGEDDGPAAELGLSENDEGAARPGLPIRVQDFNVWHRLPEPKEDAVKTEWKKYGKYEIKGRSKMLS